MPDILSVIFRRRQLILLLTLAGTAAAYLASLLSPKLYVGAATALPVNTLVNDKGRIFNQNIEGLYSEIGTADELDKIEGTAQLDTVFLAVADKHRLGSRYGLDTAAGDALDKAALLLRRNSDVSRTGYGELKIKVWDKNAETAAALANALMQTINAIHERLQTENNRAILQKLKEAYRQKIIELRSFESDEVIPEVEAGEWEKMQQKLQPDSALRSQSEKVAVIDPVGTEDRETLVNYQRLIGEYELAVKTAPKALLLVEQARPSPWHDRPKTSRNVLLAFLASLFFSFLLALFLESRKASA